ncbi:hypothetical protein ABE10_25305 [Bacillus toyonensis]|nr:hypothetical protein [Bacillus toyonensis]
MTAAYGRGLTPPSVRFFLLGADDCPAVAVSAGSILTDRDRDQSSARGKPSDRSPCVEGAVTRVPVRAVPGVITRKDVDVADTSSS